MDWKDRKDGIETFGSQKTLARHAADQEDIRIIAGEGDVGRILSVEEFGRGANRSIKIRYTVIQRQPETKRL